MEQRFINNSFIQGVVVGVVIVGLLGGVYMLGAKNGTSVSLGTKGTVNAPAPTGTAPDPSQPAVGTVKAISKDDHIIGKTNAKIILLEYSDLECPFCKQFHPTMQQLVDTYGDKVAWVYRNFPLSFHANAQKEAEAAECVADLGGNDKYWKFIDAIYERTTSNGTGFALDKLASLAKEVGVDQNKFNDCLNSGKMTKKVQTDLTEGQAAGITGTPGTIIMVDGKAQSIIPGALPFASIKTQIDALL
jgi:protein-disulfide isomerase